MKNATSSRRRGRPSLDTVRVEVMVPRHVFDQLLAEESASHGKIYRTRVACNVLCEWANARAGSGHQTS